MLREPFAELGESCGGGETLTFVFCSPASPWCLLTTLQLFRETGYVALGTQSRTERKEKR